MDQPTNTEADKQEDKGASAVKALTEAMERLRSVVSATKSDGGVSKQTAAQIRDIASMMTKAISAYAVKTEKDADTEADIETVLERMGDVLSDLSGEEKSPAEGEPAASPESSPEEGAGDGVEKRAPYLWPRDMNRETPADPS